MTTERIISEALALPPAARLDVIDQLWESLAGCPEALELTDAQREELDKRIADMDSSPGSGVAWEDVKSEFRKRR